MALSKSANTYNRQNWEQSEFPLLCQTCLGDNPYIRMIKDSYGDECRICARPYTVFRWCPGAKMRYKRTEVCQSCAQLKNVCQTCLLDLEYGLPVQARDSVLNVTDTLPKSDVGREYYLQNMEQKIAESGRAEPGGGGGKAPNDLLLKMSRTGPYYKRNRPHICSFWVKGECSRGEECPYRHEMPTDPNDPLSNQKIKDRYHGVNDPVAEKLLSSAQDLPTLSPPDDKTVTSLYIGGIDESFNQSDLRDQFYAFGEIMSIHMVTKSRYAFVTFSTRAAAEKAADSTFNKLIVKGRRLKVLWGKAQTTPSLGVKGQQTLAPVPGLPAAPPPLPFDPFGLSSKATPPPPPGGFPPPPPQISHVLGSRPPHVSQLLGPPPPPPGFPPPAGGYYPPPPSRGFSPLGPRPPTLHYPSQSPLHLGAKK